MEMIADILLAAGAFGAAAYCYVLALRLKRLQTLESGMGGAIAVLSAQVDDLTRTLAQARKSADGQVTALEDLTRRGEGVAARLELLLASMHDLPDEPGPAPQTTAPPPDDLSMRRPRYVRRRAARQGVEAAE
ncbi:hypothetical protein [Szabonella alba]|uniref:Uncharacterized protein n=1 Tax=Szabonella alba TaxID=2804194 RepID=A0A8K0VBV8_9RHOB|nr:hypothetical protein [Szabonella alba]MBL4917030.1 hypothetical protein [Szabonella alba]